jgi:hypothetical protein
MRLRPTIMTLMLMSMLMLTGLLTGCSDDATTPTSAAAGGDDYTQIDFSLPYGGLTTSDEEESFGDEALMLRSLAEEGEEVADPVADDPMVRDLENRGHRACDPADSTGPHFTFVHLRWGMLRDMMDSVSIEPPSDVIDWTGSLNEDRGVLLMRRAIRFERPLDHIIFPRLNHQTVDLVSHTACGFDGVVLQILERPEEYAEPDSNSLAPNMLHINLGEFSADIAVRDLAGLEEVYEAGTAGNSVAVTGFALSDLSVCPKGFLSGRFRRLAEDRPDSVRADDRPGEQYGVYAGMWRGLEGRIHGHLRGAYGVDEDGQRVFIGKYIGPRGGFRGLIRGTWEPGEADDMLAGFRSQWIAASGNVEGLLGGEAFAVEGTPGGFFTGRWTALCDDEAEDSVQ